MILSPAEVTLLEHVYDQSRRDTLAFVAPAEEDSYQSRREEYDDLINALVTGGYVKRPTFGPEMNITLLGIKKVEELRRQRADRPVRAQTLRKELILWLYDHHQDGTQPTIGGHFIWTDRSFYAGQPFSASEIVQALSYLRQRGLVGGTNIDQSEDLIRPTLTALGVECAESGKSVSEFLNPQQSNGPTFHVKIDGSQNVVIGTQHDFTQNNSSGIDPSVLAQLVHAASTARQSVPALGLNAHDQVIVVRLSNELEAEATSPDPEPGRLRQLMSSLGDALSSAGGSALGSVVVGAVEQAAAALG